MRTVWKLQIPIFQSHFSLPVGATVVAFQMQNGTPCLWADVETAAAPETRVFKIFGTGHQVPEGAIYVGTLQDGDLVWHCFELRGE